MAVSLRREKLEEHKEHGQQYNYRVIFRTSEVNRDRIHNNNTFINTIIIIIILHL